MAHIYDKTWDSDADAATLGTDFTTVPSNGDLRTVSHAIDCISDPCFDACTAIAAPNDGEAGLTILSPFETSSGKGIGPGYRVSTAANTGYFVLTQASQIELYKVVASTYTLINTYTTTMASGDVVAIRCVGTTISVYKNGTLLGNNTDSAIASGRAGIFGGFGTGLKGDTFYIDDLTASFTLTQSAYRGRNDDGSESGATWQAAENTGFSVLLDTAFRVRMQIDATLDPSAQTFQFDQQLVGDSTWYPIANHVGSPTLSWGATGAPSYSAANGSSVAPTYPAGITTKSALIMVVGQKPATANGGTVTTPSGWTLIGSLSSAGGYSTTIGADTGNTNIFVYKKDTVAGTETGTITVTVGDNSVTWASIYRVESSVAATFAFAMSTGSDTTAGSVSITMSADPGVTAGDFIIAGMCIPTDVTANQFSAEALSQTGITFGSVTEIEEPRSANGNDIAGFTCYASVSSGTSSAAPVLTATAGGTTTNVRGPGFFLRIRATAVQQPIEIVASSNIASSAATATTAQLTAPSGKTSGSNFQAGNISDDTNPMPSQDLASAKYTEHELCMKFLAAQGAANSQQYRIRMSKAGTALDTYSQNLIVTIGAPPASDPPPVNPAARGNRLLHF